MRVHDSQAYRKVDVTRERVSRILELREILLSFQTGFSLVNAAVVCAILKSISGLEPSSVITEPRYLKLVTVSSFCPFTLIAVLMPLVLFVISLVFSALISMPSAVEAVSIELAGIVQIIQIRHHGTNWCTQNFIQICHHRTNWFRPDRIQICHHRTNWFGPKCIKICYCRTIWFGPIYSHSSP